MAPNIAVSAAIINDETNLHFLRIASHLTPANGAMERMLGGLTQRYGAMPGSSGAGHDAGILSSVVPTGMLYVRNPTGVSHDPAEFAERDDCHAGIDALAAVMADYVSG